MKNMWLQNKGICLLTAILFGLGVFTPKMVEAGFNLGVIKAIEQKMDELKDKMQNQGYNPEDPCLLYPPANLTAQAGSITQQINLAWKDTSVNETGFKIERKTGTSSLWSQITTEAANKKNYIDTSITPDSTYYYRVCAYNSSGSSAYSNEAHATFIIATYTIRAGAGANGSITPSGTTTVAYGGSQTFTITPDIGYHTADVVVDGSSTGATGSYTFVNVTSSHTIAATFAMNTYTITAGAGANGSITPSGTTTVNYGATQVFTITPNTGYHIADVKVDGNPVGTPESYPFGNVTSSHTIAATFAMNIYTITAGAGANGSITPSGTLTVNYGATQVFVITPNTGYHIADVVVDENSVGAIGSYTFVNITTSHTIAVIFGTDTPKISVTPISYDFGTIDVGTQSAAQPFTITNIGKATLFIGTITITATDSFFIQNDNCSNSSITPAASHTVEVVFAPQSGGSKRGTLTIPSNDPDTPNFEVALKGEGRPLMITTDALPDGQVNIEYAATLTATNGIGTYTWSKISGTLTPGLTLESSTGIISGTPTIEGSFTFTVHVTDSAGRNTSKELSLYIVSAGGRTIYVNNEIGNNTYDGLSSTVQGGTVGPKKTIQTGLNVYNIGGTVSVAAGTYTEAIYISKWISLVGAGATRTTIDASGVGAASTVNFEGNATDKAKIYGFKITGATGNSEGNGNGIYCKDGACPTIGNNIIVANRLNGIYCSNSSSPTINSNTITSNTDDGIYCSFSSPTIISNDITENKNGIFCTGSSTPTIANNIIAKNKDDGIYSTSSSPKIINNTITGNKNNGIACYPTPLTVTNNIITNNGTSSSQEGYGIHYSNGTLTVDYNCVWGNGTTTTNNYYKCTVGTGSISSDPLFVGNGDYHLQSDSPCKDAGTNSAIPTWLTTDKDGRQRMNGIVDIGAYEYP
ncbi:MAG: right-handed parallel beta-helix repeat-containing protein [Candidatus Desantisbacteria bacterium]